MLNLRTTYFVIVIVLTIVTGVSAHAENQRGGHLIIALEADYPPFDPLTMGALVERTVAASFYETLYELNQQGELVPLLAKSHNVSDDGLTYTIQLREEIQFHDGTPFNAEAVVFNFQRLLKPENGCRCIAEISVVDNVSTVDEYTVKFELASANAGFLALLSDVSGMQPSPAAIAKHGEDFATQPVGTGPFQFVQWDRGVALTVERNPNYWQSDLPYLDSVEYRPVPDSQTRMASLQAGDIHVATVPAPEDVAAVTSGRRNFNLIEAPALGTVFTMFNTQRPPFDDNRVRQALFHGIDRKTINDALNRGIYPLINNPFGNGLFNGDITNHFPDFDPDKSRELLSAYGKPVRFELSIVPSPTQVRMAQVLQQMWKQLGVDATIAQFEQRQLVGKAINRDFDAMLFRWSGRADPDLNSYQFFHSQSPRNYTRYSNPRMDQLLSNARGSQNRNDRLLLYQQVGELLAEDGPYLFLWAQSYFFITQKNVQNLAPIPGGIPRVREVWLSQ